MRAALSLLSLAACCLAGSREVRSRPAGMLLGAAAWAAAAWLPLLAFDVLAPAWLDLALLAGAGFVLWRCGSAKPHREPEPRLLRWLVAGAAAVAMATFAAELWRAPDGGWDAALIWTLRARLLSSATPLETALDPRLYHTDYPLLVPLAVARAAALGAWAPALVAGASAALCAAALWSFAPAGARGFVTATLLTTPLFGTLAAAQYADVPLAALFLVALGLSLRRSWIAAGLAAGLLPFVKNEGALHLVALVAAVAVTSPRSLPRFLAGSIAPLALVLSFKLDPRSQPNDLVAGAGGALQHLADPHRWLAVAQAFAAEPFHLLTWGLAPLLVVAALLVRRDRFALIALGLPFAGLFAVYLATPKPLDWHLSTSLSRVLFHLWPGALLAAAPALEPRSTWT